MLKRLASTDATMGPGRALLALAIALVLSLALTLLLRTADEGRAEEPPPPAADAGLSVEWAFIPGGVPELTDAASAVVEVEVEAVRAGDDLVAQGAAEDGGDALTPTQRVDVRTLDTLSGSAPAQFTLFKLGSNDVYAEGDPPYEVGRHYVLFVRPRLADDGSGRHSDGTWLPAAPDGRLVEQGGTVEPLIEGPVGEQLDGKSVAAVEREVDSSGGGQ